MIILIFIAINHIISLIAPVYLDIFVKSSPSGCCLAFAIFFANFSRVLLTKVLLIKKTSVIESLNIPRSALGLNFVRKLFVKLNPKNVKFTAEKK